MVLFFYLSADPAVVSAGWLGSLDLVPGRARSPDGWSGMLSP